jgi:hypothetical protein
MPLVKNKEFFSIEFLKRSGQDDAGSVGGCECAQGLDTDFRADRCFLKCRSFDSSPQRRRPVAGDPDSLRYASVAQDDTDRENKCFPTHVVRCAAAMDGAPIFVLIVHPRSQNQGPGAPRYVIDCSEMDSALMFAIDEWERCYDGDSLLEVMGGWDDSTA